MFKDFFMVTISTIDLGTLIFIENIVYEIVTSFSIGRRIVDIL